MNLCFEHIFVAAHALYAQKVVRRLKTLLGSLLDAGVWEVRMEFHGRTYMRGGCYYLFNIFFRFVSVSRGWTAGKAYYANYLMIWIELAKFGLGFRLYVYA